MKRFEDSYQSRAIRYIEANPWCTRGQIAEALKITRKQAVTATDALKYEKRIYSRVTRDGHTVYSTQPPGESVQAVWEKFCFAGGASHEHS